MFDALPNKKYSIIYADQPWHYDMRNIDNANKKETGAYIHYPTLTFEELKALPVKDIACDDCLLFLWAVSPSLDIAIDLGKEWSFKYITIAFVWDKIRCNVGHYTLSQCEIVLLFKKGKRPVPRGTANERQYIREMRGEHSRKPIKVKEAINRMFPTQQKIELFARPKDQTEMLIKQSEELNRNWDLWGNEVNTTL